MTRWIVLCHSKEKKKKFGLRFHGEKNRGRYVRNFFFFGGGGGGGGGGGVAAAGVDESNVTLNNEFMICRI